VSRKTVIPALACVLLMALLSFVLWIVAPRSYVESRTGRSGTTNFYTSTPKGMKAFVELLEYFKVPVHRYRKTPAQLSQHYDPNQSIYMILNPSRIAWNEGDAYYDSLLEWVRQGGVVILSADEAMLQKLQWEELKKILDDDHSEYSDFSESEPFSTQVAIGDGTFVFLSPGSLFLNEEIGQSNNAWTVFGFVTQFAPRLVILDEFYHGFVDAPTLSQLAFRYPYNVVTTSLIIFLLLFIGSRLFHFGPPLQEKTVMRSRSEFLESLARLYRKIEDYPFVLQKIMKGYEAELSVSRYARWQEKWQELVDEKNALKTCSHSDLIYFTEKCHQFDKEKFHE
jgi:hypothetical protein